jgi:phosphotransferase system  glucose/maltose/N-acetylglucosamine-specific IIC component
MRRYPARMLSRALALVPRAPKRRISDLNHTGRLGTISSAILPLSKRTFVFTGLHVLLPNPFWRRSWWFTTQSTYGGGLSASDTRHRHSRHSR